MANRTPGFHGKPNLKGRIPGSTAISAPDKINIERWIEMGFSEKYIAEKIGRTEELVHRVVVKLNAARMERYEQSIAKEKASQLQTYSYMLQAASAAWRLSSNEPVDPVIEGNQVQVPPTSRFKPILKPGDPAFLKAMDQAMTQKRRILGIEKTMVEANFNLSEITEEAERLALEHQLEEQVHTNGNGEAES